MRIESGKKYKFSIEPLGDMVIHTNRPDGHIVSFFYNYGPSIESLYNSFNYDVRHHFVTGRVESIRQFNHYTVIVLEYDGKLSFE